MLLHTVAPGTYQTRTRITASPDTGRASKQAVFLIGLGYPADRPLRPLTQPNRRPFDDVVHWNRW